MDAHAGRPRPGGRRAAFVALAAVLVAATSLATAPIASAQTGGDAPEVTVTDLQWLPDTQGTRSIHGINDRGQVVGSSGREPVLWEEGRPVGLWSEPGSSLAAEHVNDRGDIVLQGYDEAYFRRDGQVSAIDPAGDRTTYTVDVVDLNESGQVLVDRRVVLDQAIGRVFELWQDGTATDLRLPPPPEGLEIRLAELSDGGHVVLEYGRNVPLWDVPIWRPTGGALVWHEGTVTRLSSSEAFVASVNRNGQVVGRDPFGGVLWSGGRTTRLPFAAADINDRGQVVGSGTVNERRRAMLWESGRATDLGTLGGDTSRALAINERGQVLGDSTTADGQTHAFLWTNGHMVDLGMLSRLPWDPKDALNDEGQAIGDGGTPSAARPVMWTVRGGDEPPEPPPERCFTTTNQAHVQAGRATSFLVFTWAAGSGTYLGLASQTTSLREAAPGRWEPVTSC